MRSRKATDPTSKLSRVDEGAEIQRFPEIPKGFPRGIGLANQRPQPSAGSCAMKLRSPLFSGAPEAVVKITDVRNAGCLCAPTMSKFLAQMAGGSAGISSLGSFPQLFSPALSTTPPPIDAEHGAMFPSPSERLKGAERIKTQMERS